MGASEKTKKMAIKRGRALQRRAHPDRNYLTIAKRSCRCSECDKVLRAGEEFVYRHEPKRVLCATCADRLEIKYRPSLNWERARIRPGAKSGKVAAPRRRGGETLRSAVQRPLPSRAEIEAARHTHEQLAEWGVKLPPRKGWRKRLLREADRRDGTSPPTQPAVCGSEDDRDDSRVREGEYAVGELHRAWPEWVWDGAAFVKTEAST